MGAIANVLIHLVQFLLHSCMFSSVVFVQHSTTYFCTIKPYLTNILNVSLYSSLWLSVMYDTFPCMLCRLLISGYWRQRITQVGLLLHGTPWTHGCSGVSTPAVLPAVFFLAFVIDQPPLHRACVETLIARFTKEKKKPLSWVVKADAYCEKVEWGAGITSATLVRLLSAFRAIMVSTMYLMETHQTAIIY